MNTCIDILITLTGFVLTAFILGSLALALYRSFRRSLLETLGIRSRSREEDEE